MCHRCAHCCQEIGYPHEPAKEHAIAQQLGISYEDFITTYIGDIIGNQKVNPKPRAPCPFLSGNTCTIYQVRPCGCRKYPLKTDCGSAGIDCKGYKEFTRVKEALIQEIYDDREFDWNNWGLYVSGRPLRRPTSDIMTNLYQKFLNGHPSSKMEARFNKTNHIAMP
ncbi:YkgJ family cysteine cluster protein [Chloroflexota bacterium]